MDEGERRCGDAGHQKQCLSTVISLATLVSLVCAPQGQDGEMLDLARTDIRSLGDRTRVGGAVSASPVPFVSAK